MNNVLDVKNLVVSFTTKEGEIQAVRDVSFSIKEGETFVILGESGCGKTVLCKSILRILPENAIIKGGRLIFNGRDLLTLSQKTLDAIRGKDISMVFQNPMTSLNPTISIGNQIMESILIHQKMSKKEAKRQSIELMERVGLDHAEKRFKQYPHHFSGGMRQRSVIAIALAAKPKILIADEPTTALDVTTQSHILELIQELQRDIGISLIFITHDLGVAAKIGQRVAIMYAGKIIEIGTAKDIFNDPRHPYTWGLISSLPRKVSDEGFLTGIQGAPPKLLNPPAGDAFAVRNKNALKIDYHAHPPMFKISETHSAATWLLHDYAPRVRPEFKLSEGRVIANEA